PHRLRSLLAPVGAVRNLQLRRPQRQRGDHDGQYPEKDLETTFEHGVWASLPWGKFAICDLRFAIEEKHDAFQLQIANRKTQIESSSSIPRPDSPSGGLEGEDAFGSLQCAQHERR